MHSILNTIVSGKLFGKLNYSSMKAVTQSGINYFFRDSSVVSNEMICFDPDSDPSYIIGGIAVISYTSGHRVSSNVAPSTATRSVVHNAQFAAAYEGMHLFKPKEVSLS